MSSKLSTFCIDCQGEDLEASTRFWAAALRREVKPAEDDKYRDFRCSPGEPLLILQRVDHPSRIHLDIETDDIPGEVARLTALGAKEIERIRTWVVMEAPTGQRFCVVRQQRPEQIPPPFEGEQALLAVAGHYHGTARRSGASVSESQDTLYAEPMLGGRWLRLQWFGSVTGQPRSGEIVLGRNGSTHEMSWVDTFYTGPSLTFCSGPVRDDGRLVLTGMGWRIEWQLAPLRMRATREGKETLGIDVDWMRDSA